MIVAIIGGRNFNDYKGMCRKLERWKDQIKGVVSGGAAGADALAEKWAKDNDKPINIIRADWGKYGDEAGYLRNHDVISSAELVIAFWDGKSRGTSHAIGLAQQGPQISEIYLFDGKTGKLKQEERLLLRKNKKERGGSKADGRSSRGRNKRNSGKSSRQRRKRQGKKQNNGVPTE